MTGSEETARRRDSRSGGVTDHSRRMTPSLCFRTPRNRGPPAVKPYLFLIGVLPLLAGAEPAPRAQAVPSDWVDPATGHRVIRLSGEEGGSSLYCHQNT